MTPARARPRCIPLPALLPIALAAALLPAGCLRNRDPFYARNADLIAVLDRAEKREGSARYLVEGREGQLFYLEDIRAVVSKWHLDPHNVGALRALDAALDSAGVRLLVLPGPSKAETYPEWLTGRESPLASEAKTVFFQDLEAAGVEALDLRAALHAAKPGRALYPRTDTHWSSAAIRIAASELAARLPAWKSPGSPYAYRDTVITDYHGDLALKFVAPEARRPETLAVRTVRDTLGRPFPEPDHAEILLYGDSFLNQHKNLAGHLGALLSLELGRPVKTLYSVQGIQGSPDRIRALAAENPGVRVVIFTFTSRSLMEKM